MFRLRSLGSIRGGKPALDGVSVEFAPGEFVCLCGMNGAGKSTLLEIMAGILRDYSGDCELESRELRAWQPRELARRVSFLPQIQPATPGFTAREVVRMGRHPFSDLWHESPDDSAICDHAMRVAGCDELRHRAIHELSGGERQRVLFAATLAQQPAVLLLDEPGTFVDLPHQIQMFRTLRELCAAGVLCVAATHDLNLAAAFASRLVLLHQGRIAADGAPASVLPGERFREVFGSHVRIQSSTAGPRVYYAG